MELILHLYILPYNPDYPVVCFDERPCFLIGDTVQGLEMEAGKVAKENYAYSKHGSACLLAAIEPKTGKRLVHVRRRRTKKEFTRFMQALAKLYPDAVKIIVIMDNLNTHNFSAFYQHLCAEEAAQLAQRFELVYTPKSASWLNMIEIEFSALSRQCLNRRIPSINQLAKEVFTYFKERSDKGIKINWQFSQENARQKLNRHYEKVNPLNLIYK
jgi:transposase